MTLTWQVHSVQLSTVHSSLSLYTMPLWMQIPTWMFIWCFSSSLTSDCGGGRGRKGLIRTKDGKVSLCQSSSTNESLTDTVIKTSLDSSGAVQIQPTANQHICVFRWVSLRFWPQAAITVTSGYTRRILKLEAKGKMERRGGNSGRGQSLVELTTLRRPMDSFSTTIPSPLTSLNMLAMSTQDRPQTAWTSGWRGGKKTVNDFISF